MPPNLPQNVSYVVGILIAIVAVLTYRKNAQTRRAEWLVALHQKFYETDRYRHIREALDPDEAGELDALRTRLAASKPDKDLEDLVDYLNFFELVATLQARKQLKPAEVRDLFDYYLHNIAKDPLVYRFVRQGGFENLTKVLEGMDRKG